MASSRAFEGYHTHIQYVVYTAWTLPLAAVHVSTQTHHWQSLNRQNVHQTGAKHCNTMQQLAQHWCGTMCKWQMKVKITAFEERMTTKIYIICRFVVFLIFCVRLHFAYDMM